MKRLSLCTFPAKSRYGFRREREKMGRRGVVFCDVYDAPLLPLSFDRSPPNFPRTRGLGASSRKMVSYSRKVSIKGSNFPKNRLLGYFGVPCLCSAYGSRETFCDAYSFHPLVDIPQIYHFWVTFAAGCTVFQLSTSESHPLPQYQQRR